MKYFPLAVLGLAITLGGCASTGQQANPSADLQQQLDQARTAQSQLQSQNANLKQQLAASQTNASSSQSMGNGINLIPPNAKPGECFARLLTPAKFQTKSERVLQSAASTRIETTPAKFEWTTQRILIRPESTKLVAVPATYKKESKRELVKPSYTKWVPGTGANQRVDPITGEVMCLVTVPAEYRTVTTRVVDTAATTKTVKVPAEYKTVKVRKLVSEAQSHSIDIPAKYQTVTHTEQVSNPTLVWRRVVCERNATNDLILAVQKALKKSGYNPGPIDGLIGPQTLRGTRAYDKDKGLAYSKAGVISYETLTSLGVTKP